jgi:hypothetical protein
VLAGAAALSLSHREAMKRTAKHGTRSAAGPGAGGVAVATRTFNFVLPSGETERRDTYAQFPARDAPGASGESPPGSEGRADAASTPVRRLAVRFRARRL